MTAMSFAPDGFGLPKIFGKLGSMPTTTEHDDALAMFGEAVLRRRRDELQLNQAEVAQRGGPSTTTQTKIEAGLPPIPHPRTLRKIDAGLGWVEGSAYRLLHHGEPPEDARPRAASNRLEAVPELPQIKGGPLRRLLQIRRELDEVIEELRAE